MWNVSAVPPPPQRMRAFTRGRFHNLQRMMRVAGWMSQGNVDDRLERLLGLYNARSGFTAGRMLQYQRLQAPVPGNFICSAVHSDSDNRNSFLYQCLRERLSWTDNAEIVDDTIAFFLFFLKGTFIWPRVRGMDIAVPGSSHVDGAGHIPRPEAAGAWRCAVALCLASLTSAMIPTHDSCHILTVAVLCTTFRSHTLNQQPTVRRLHCPAVDNVDLFRYG